MSDQSFDVLQEIAHVHLGPGATQIEFAGQGDFCRAYSVNDEWIFLLAWNGEGSRSLEVEARLLPVLAARLPLPIPHIAYSGRQRSNDFAFLAYPRIDGAQFTADVLASCSLTEQEAAARHLALFLRQLHATDPALARQAGVVECNYPFCRTEDGILQGTAADLYTTALDGLLTYPRVGAELADFCRRLTEALIEDAERPLLPPVLVHGDFSDGHILFDPAERRIAGVIDFSDVILTTPLLDFAYLYASYGEQTTRRVLTHYLGKDISLLERVFLGTRRLHQWRAALRLLWALEHGYNEGVTARLGILRDLCSRATP